MPIKGAGAMLAAAEPVVGREQLTVPLVAALEYDARHRTELERTGDAESSFAQVAGRTGLK